MKQERNSGGDVIKETAQSAKMKKIGIYAGIALLIFMLGFVPMWLSSREYKQERDQVQSQLRPSLMQNELGAAALNARRGEYEPARQQISDFYTDLRTEYESSSSVFKTAEQRQIVQKMLGERDETVTLLARNDVASAERLANLYFTFIQAKDLSASLQNKQ